jgi:hypothetical protein
MADSNSLVNLGDLSKPATVLIEKISNAIGAVYKPHQIKRVAKAEAEAAKTLAMSKLEITELEQRALQRFLEEETIKQRNIESIISEALPQINANADPSRVDNDWIANFFNQSKLTSDVEMKKLWGAILAGEGNSPGAFSKRTVNIVASLDKQDAELFAKLNNFRWYLGSEIHILIYDTEEEIYNENGINFASLQHLDSLGLINFEPLAGYATKGIPTPDGYRNTIISYFDTWAILEFPNDLSTNTLNVGSVFLTRAGKELSQICKPQPIAELSEYIFKKWREQNLTVTVMKERAAASKSRKGSK